MRPSARPTRQLSPFASRPGYHGRRHPVDVIEREPGAGERLLPEWPPIGIVLVGLEAKYGGTMNCARPLLRSYRARPSCSASSTALCNG
jgi:hypothetical protein